MNIITEPSVYVVGRQTVDDAELDRFLADHGVAWESDSEVAGEVLTETAGRVCYMSFAKPRPGGNSAYLTHIKEVGHGSVLEHAVWNLLITGVSRSLTHELVRHRAGMSYSMLSQRYVDESDCAFVVPPELREEIDEAWAAWHRCWHSPNFDWNEYEIVASRQNKAISIGIEWIYAMAEAQRRYERLADYLVDKFHNRFTDERAYTAQERTEIRKAARQAARSVLPNACETKIFVTGNARALRHFIEMRGSRHADTEIRRLAGAVLDVLVKESPNLFGDYKKTLLPDGTYEITTQFMKV